MTVMKREMMFLHAFRRDFGSRTGKQTSNLRLVYAENIVQVHTEKAQVT